MIENRSFFNDYFGGRVALILCEVDPYLDFFNIDSIIELVEIIELRRENACARMKWSLLP